MIEDFWLYKWIDEFGLSRNDDRLTHLLKDHKAVARLHNLAEAETFEMPPAYEGPDNALVAGRSIDLSDDLDCCFKVSRIWQINRDFPRVLHYFDRLVIAGPSAEKYADVLQHPLPRYLTQLANHVDGLLYLREIGADEIVEFQPKVPISPKNYKQLAKKFDVNSAIEGAAEFIEILAREGSVSDLRQCSAGDHWHFSFYHPMLAHSNMQVLWQRKKPTKKQMARAVYDEHASLFTSDVISARMMELPLGVDGELHTTMLAKNRHESLIGETAMKLYLPVLEGLPVRDIICLRKDEYEHFEKFQLALRTAIKAQLAEAGNDPERAAAEVQREIIDPAISDIHLRLRAAESSLTKKISVSISVGSAVTVVGAVGAIPPVMGTLIGTGLAAGATSIAALHTYFDRKKDIELSDMYFLWLLEKASYGHMPGAGVISSRHSDIGEAGAS
jgi:hypothetical protein